MPKRQNLILNRENLFGVLIGVSLVGASVLILPHLHSGNEPINESVAAFDPPSFDFGKAFQAETIKHNFRLVNHSTNKISIVAIRTSCRCTLIEKDLVGSIIPPESFLVVPVEFYSGVDRGVGNAKVEALLECHGERYYARAFIGGQVDPDFEFEPSSLEFGQVTAGEKATQTIKLIPRALENLTVKQPESIDNLQTSLFTNTVGFSSKAFILQVTFNAPLVKFSQVFSRVINVQTSSKRVPNLMIPVSAVIRPELEIAPDTIVLPANGSSGESRFTIRTIQPSQIIRAFLTKDNFSKELPATINGISSEESWDTTHIRLIANSSLTDADKITFELMVRNENGQTEAKSVFVQVKSL